MYKKERVKGYEEYQVDTNGVVYSKRGFPLKYSINHNGYCIINFYVNRKRKGFGIHRLVAKQFIPNTDPNKNEINHKDGNKQNNNVENLEWCTSKYNSWHLKEVLNYDNSGKNNGRSKRVKGIDCKTNLLKYEFDSLVDAGRYFGDNKNYRYIQNCISRVVSGKRKTYKNCKWYVTPQIHNS